MSKSGNEVLGIVLGLATAGVGMYGYVSSNNPVEFNSLSKIEVPSSVEAYERTRRSKGGKSRTLTFVLPNDVKVTYPDWQAKYDDLKYYLVEDIAKTFWIDSDPDGNESHGLWQVEIVDQGQSETLISYQEIVDSHGENGKWALGAGIAGIVIFIWSLIDISRK